MATKKLGTLIKEARSGADMTQEELARKVSGLSASDISKAERGQKDLTQAQLKAIAKATGVTQASLLNAAKGSSAKKSSTKSSTKSTTKSSSTKSSIKVTATEKKLLEAYRKADSDTRKAAMSLLKGESTGTQEMLGNLLENAMEMLTKK